MSKELEDLENYLFNEWKQNHVNFGCDYKLEAELDKQLNNLKSVKQALQRLEQIDNAKPSEALKGLKHIKKYYVPQPCSCRTYDYLEIVEQALLKAQEQEKVLDIIKKKRVDLPYLRCCFEDNQSVERYNEYIRNKTMDYDHEEELTKEEFDLLKRWLG